MVLKCEPRCSTESSDDAWHINYETWGEVNTCTEAVGVFDEETEKDY